MKFALIGYGAMGQLVEQQAMAAGDQIGIQLTSKESDQDTMLRLIFQLDRLFSKMSRRARWQACRWSRELPAGKIRRAAQRK